jgi:hypothetical protein
VQSLSGGGDKINCEKLMFQEARWNRAMSETKYFIGATQHNVRLQ